MFYVLIDDDDDDVDVDRTSPISRTWLFRIIYLLFDRWVFIFKKNVEENNRLL